MGRIKECGSPSTINILVRTIPCNNRRSFNRDSAIELAHWKPQTMKHLIRRTLGGLSVVGMIYAGGVWAVPHHRMTVG